MHEPLLIADYTVGGRGQSATLTFSHLVNGQRHGAGFVEVAGKVQARKVARAHGATPWNF